MKHQSKPTFEFEKAFWRESKLVAGVDEAGRGPLAGPVVAAAVILPNNCIIDGINDSKLLKASYREELFEIISREAVSIGIGVVENVRIDEINIFRATEAAMKAAVGKLKPAPQQLLIDGKYFKDFGIPSLTIVKGDAKCVSIAAASIIAKVTRDRWMTEVADRLYPGYGFAIHKGYATKVHFEKLVELGETPIHRQTFLRKFNARQGGLFEIFE